MDPEQHVTFFTLQVHDAGMLDFLCYCFSPYEGTTWMEVQAPDWELLYKKCIDKSATAPYSKWRSKVKQAVRNVIYDAWHKRNNSIKLLHRAAKQGWQQLFEHVLCHNTCLTDELLSNLGHWCICYGLGWPLLFIHNVSLTHDLSHFTMQSIAEGVISQVSGSNTTVLQYLLDHTTTNQLSLESLVVTAIRLDHSFAVQAILQKMDTCASEGDTRSEKLQDTLECLAACCLQCLSHEGIITTMVEHIFIGHSPKDRLEALLPIAQERGFTALASRLQDALA